MAEAEMDATRDMNTTGKVVALAEKSRRVAAESPARAFVHRPGFGVAGN